MSNLNKLNGWTGDGGYTSRTSAQSYLASKTNNMNSSSCGLMENNTANGKVVVSL